MSDELKTIKFQLMLAASEAQAIDDWGFSHRIRTRAEAIRRLCKMAIYAGPSLRKLDEAENNLTAAVANLTKSLESDTRTKSAYFDKAASEIPSLISDHTLGQGEYTGDNIEKAHELLIKEVEDISNLMRELYDYISFTEGEWSTNQTFRFLDNTKAAYDTYRKTGRWSDPNEGESTE